MCRTRDDLLDELADVIITAVVAMCAITSGRIPADVLAQYQAAAG